SAAQNAIRPNLCSLILASLSRRHRVHGLMASEKQESADSAITRACGNRPPARTESPRVALHSERCSVGAERRRERKGDQRITIAESTENRMPDSRRCEGRSLQSAPSSTPRLDTPQPSQAATFPHDDIVTMLFRNEAVSAGGFTRFAGQSCTRSAPF